MNKLFRRDSGPRLELPRIGQRITKTSVAVFLCLLYYCLRGYRGQDMPTEAAITAIICMQPYVRDTRSFAINRMVGTLIGGFWGLLFLLLLLIFPGPAQRLVLLYALMAVGVLLSLYSTVLFHMPDASSLAAIVFLCVVIAFPDIEDPLRESGDRIFGVLLGTAAAIVVNVARLPRDKMSHRLFFLRLYELSPDRFSSLSSAAQFRLSYLQNDGAKICLISEHAPAFFHVQTGGGRYSAPLIVMDGAAVYDANENRYLWVGNIHADDATQLRDRLKQMGLSCFVYTVHKNKTCIFHHGKLRESERLVYKQMRSSPYRDYLEGEIYDAKEIVYFKIIGSDSEIETVSESLSELISRRHMRAVIRPQAGTPGVSALYIYDGGTGEKQAMEHVLQLLREEDPALESVAIFSRQPYRSEHDAMQLLHRLGESYEPLKLLRLLRRKKK